MMLLARTRGVLPPVPTEAHEYAALSFILLGLSRQHYAEFGLRAHQIRVASAGLTRKSKTTGEEVLARLNSQWVLDKARKEGSPVDEKAALKLIESLSKVLKPYKGPMVGILDEIAKDPDYRAGRTVDLTKRKKPSS